MLTLAALLVTLILVPERTVLTRQPGLWLPDSRAIVPPHEARGFMGAFGAAPGPAGIRSAPAGGAAGPAIMFAAQWRTLGNTQTERRDGGRFDSGGAGCNVVTAASTGISGWPTDNVLRVPAALNDIAGANLRISKTDLPNLDVGASRYSRVYMASTMSDGTTDDSAHPIEATTGPEEWAIIHWWERDDVLVYPNWVWGMFTDQHGHCIEATGNGFPIPYITRNQHEVYRIEWALHRDSSTTFTMQARLYNAAGTLLADENDLFYGSGATLAGRTHTIANVAAFNRIDVGSNQGGWMPEGSNPQNYTAALAISAEDWLGPYNATNEANWDA